MMETTFFRDLAYVFGAAVVGGSVAKATRQPLILGYVLGGFLIGPFTPGPTLSEVHQFEVLAEIGVILLMYSIGLEFSFAELLQVKWVAIFGGPLGILLSLGMGAGAGWSMGWGTTQGIAVGAIVSVASTMVLSRLLADRGELRSGHGKVMIGITLVEDLAVVVSDTVSAAQVIAAVRHAGGPLLAGAEVFDVYRDPDRIGQGNVSLAIRLTYRAPDRTLTDEEVAGVRETIVARLRDELGAEPRA